MSRAVVLNWWVATQKWVADPFWMGRGQLVKLFFFFNAYPMFDMSFILKNYYFERHASDTCSRLGAVAMVTATSLTLTVCVAMAKR